MVAIRETRAVRAARGDLSLLGRALLLAAASDGRHPQQAAALLHRLLHEEAPVCAREDRRAVGRDKPGGFGRAARAPAMPSMPSIIRSRKPQTRVRTGSVIEPG